MKIKLFAVGLLTALLTACSGGGQSTLTPATKTQEAAATAVKSPLKFLVQSGMAPNGRYVAKYIVAPGQDAEADAKIGAEQQEALRSNVYHATKAELDQMKSPRVTADDVKRAHPEMQRCMTCISDPTDPGGGVDQDLGWVDASTDNFFGSGDFGGSYGGGGGNIGGGWMPNTGECLSVWNMNFVTGVVSCGYLRGGTPSNPNIYFDESYTTYGQCQSATYRYSRGTGEYSLNSCPMPTLKTASGVYNAFPTFAYSNLNKAPIAPVIIGLNSSFAPIGAKFSVFVNMGQQYNFTNLNVILAEQGSNLPRGIFFGGGQSIGALIVTNP